MRHHQAHRTLSRERNQRRALLRSMARSLITHGRITTTEARAKELRSFVEQLVTKSKEDTVARRRLVQSRLGGNDKTPTKTLFEHIAPRMKERNGGYTRIIKLEQRDGRGRKEAVIEFVA